MSDKIKNREKKCKRKECGKTKKITEFYRDSTSADGYRNICKECCRKLWYKAKKDFRHRELFRMINHKGKKTKIVKLCGFEVGIIAELSPGEVLAYSNLQGFRILKTISSAKQYLYEQVVKAGIMINKVLTRRSEKILKNYGLRY